MRNSKICIYCDKEFYSKRIDAKACSQKCSDKISKKKKKKIVMGLTKEEMYSLKSKIMRKNRTNNQILYYYHQSDVWKIMDEFAKSYHKIMLKEKKKKDAKK